jgi:hypothetical protein
MWTNLIIFIGIVTIGIGLVQKAGFRENGTLAAV